jgi:hypothetical protein
MGLENGIFRYINLKNEYAKQRYGYLKYRFLPPYSVAENHE